MISLRNIALAGALAAPAALSSASCALSDTPVTPADDPTSDQASFSGDRASGERTAQSQPRSPGYEAPVFRAPIVPAPSPSFTFSCAGFWNGVWCGGNQGFPGSSHALYYCSDGTGQLITTCPGLCVGGPAGVEDHC
jgi:hypothetical protein